ncbi:MAG: pyridoxamine 5'-phosphate oxidase family protein [Chitinophagaceae bacterium]
MAENLPFDNSYLKFIQQKITDIRSALFFSENSDVLKIANDIITALKADDEGCIWFFVSKPTQSLDNFEKEFPARLDFYRKGKNYFLQITGKAYIVENVQLIDELFNVAAQLKQSVNTVVLIKLKIAYANCFEISIPETQNGWINLPHKFYNWLFPHNAEYKPYQLNSDAAIGWT